MVLRSPLDTAAMRDRGVSGGAGGGGFSLLELVLVIAIIATLAAIAVPRYGGAVARYRIEAAARRIVEDLALARASARSKSASVTVTFDVAANQYQLSGVASLNDPQSDAELNLSDPPYRARLVSAVLGGDNAVVFNGFGAPDSGGMIVIAGGAVTKTIVLDVDSGTATAQ